MNTSSDNLLAPPSTPYLAPVPLPYIPALEWLCINGINYWTLLDCSIGLLMDYAPFDTYVDPEVYISLVTSSFIII